MAFPESGEWSLQGAKSKILVYTYKAGLLAKLAHDLVLEAREMEGVFTFGPDGGAMVTLNPAAFHVISDNVDASQKADIRKNIYKKVLMIARYPKLSGTLMGTPAEGTTQADARFEIAGRQAGVRFGRTISAHEGGLRLKGTLNFPQTRFGIAPFKAMLGALKIKDEIKVSLDLLFMPT